jgi:nitrite reductase/ring-hydroxylating ferredoxin subunit
MKKVIKINLNKLPKKIGDFDYYDFPEYKIEFLISKLDTNNYKVLSSFCPHFGGPLELKNNSLYCYFHGYEFDIDSGKCLNRKIGSKCIFYEYKLLENFMYFELE